MIDSRMLKAGQKFKELCESYVIMITQKDYLGYGLPIYTINRHVEELGTVFQDGSHIIYVNGSYKGNDPIGKLMSDFGCKNSKDMYYKELAEGVKHFKEEGGREVMCEAVEEYAKEMVEEYAMEKAKEMAEEYAMEKAKEMMEEYAMEKAKEIAEEYAMKKAKEATIRVAVEEGIEYGIDKERVLSRVCKKYNLTRAEAEEIYEACLANV